MAKLTWDDVTKRFFELGVEEGVLFVQAANGTYGDGVAFNGLVSVSDSPTGAEPSPFYANNIKYLELFSKEEYAGSFEAFTTPDEFDACIGINTPVAGVGLRQQARSKYGMAYTTKIGNDVEGADHAFKIHLVYGAAASPSEKQYQTEGETPEPITFSYDFTTTPVKTTGHKPTAKIEIDSRTVDQTKLTAFLLIIHGDDAIEPRLPLPDEVLTLLAAG